MKCFFFYISKKCCCCFIKGVERGRRSPLTSVLFNGFHKILTTRLRIALIFSFAFSNVSSSLIFVEGQKRGKIHSLKKDKRSKMILRKRLSSNRLQRYSRRKRGNLIYSKRFGEFPGALELFDRVQTTIDLVSLAILRKEIFLIAQTFTF